MFVYRIVIVRELAVSDYAVFALLMTFFNWVLLFSHFDLYAAVSKYVGELMVKAGFGQALSYYVNALFLALGLSLLSFGVAVVVQRGCGVGLFSLVVLFSATLPFACMHISDGFLKGLGRFKLSGILGGLDGLLRLGLLAGFLMVAGAVTLAQALRLFSYAYWLVGLAAAGMVWWLGRAAVFEQGRWARPIPRIMRRLLAYAKWVTLADIVSTGLVLVNIYLIAFRSSRDVAVFNVVWLLYNIFQLAFGVVTTVLIPQVSRNAAQGSLIRLPGIKEFGAASLLALALVLFISFMPFKAEVMRLVFKRAEYANCLDYMAILLVGMPFQLFTMINKGICQGLDRPRAIALAELACFGINLPLFWWMYCWQKLPGAFGAILLIFVLEYLLVWRVTAVAVREHNASLI
ncbi:MAG: Polysaccharide biosynthesis protein [Deltaproteobacteria bacterium ADurb.Bin510]|nr:MAG: Polysaccharide biosynthesis protein [Deltaproteobacteria bacterium ADurb.Bin510]